MIIALCVDDNMGLAFNKRRQSKDSAVRKKLIQLSDGDLRMSPYSARQFDETVYGSSDYLETAETGQWCFCEDTEYLKFSDRIEKIYLFRWNRSYPSDLKFSFPGECKLVSQEEFPGTSHDCITLEVYER